MLVYSVSYVSIVVAAVVGFVSGFIWWGPLFGMTWAKLNGMTAKDMQKAKEKGMTTPMIIMALSNIVMAYALSVLLMTASAATLSAALAVSFLVWLGFVASIMVGSVIWENKPTSLFVLNSIGWLVVMSLMAISLTFF